MEKTELINPRWLRVWHAATAILFLVLVATGLSMHYVDAAWTPLPFPLAVRIHNACGVATAALWVFFVVANARSQNGHNYRPQGLNVASMLRIQLRYYAVGMFYDDPPPFPAGVGGKFNPVQQLFYIGVMYGLMPVAVLSGLVLLFPILAPERALDWAGLRPAAIAHLATGYLLTLFLVFHIYLATTGKTVSELYQEMRTGIRRSEQ